MNDKLKRQFRDDMIAGLFAVAIILICCVWFANNAEHINISELNLSYEERLQRAYDEAYQAAYEAAYASAVAVSTGDTTTEDKWCVPLSAEQLDLVERVVMAEAGNQPYAGQLAVAQCILDRMTTYDMDAESVIYAPSQFAAPYSKGPVTQSVKEAVYAVFHDGQRIATAPLLFFYSTAGGFVSTEHEGRQYVMTIDDHKFFN